MKIVRTADAPWTSGSEVIESMTPAWREHLGPKGQVEEAYRYYRQRSLCNDQVSTRRFDEIELMPGYSDATAAYHDSVEESYIIFGVSIIDGEGSFEGGDYFWRPPGWVHMAHTTTGFRAIISLEGECVGEGSERASRVIRPLEELGTNALPESDRLVPPRGRVVKCSASEIEPGLSRSGVEFPWATDGITDARIRILSHNPQFGSFSSVFDFEPNTVFGGVQLPKLDVQLFVISGSCKIGEIELSQGDYVEIDAGEMPGELLAMETTQVFVKCNIKKS